MIIEEKETSDGGVEERTIYSFTPKQPNGKVCRQRQPLFLYIF